MIVSDSFAKDLEPGVKGWWGKSYKDYTPEYTGLFETVTSKRAFEEYVQYTGLGLASVKREGAAIRYDDMEQGWVTRIQPVVYALGFAVSREAAEDGMSNIVAKKRARYLARSFHQTKETVAANLYNRAFDSNYTGPDAVSLCSTAHVNWKGGTFSNRSSTDVDFSEAALEQACIDIAGWQDDRGLKIAVKPWKLCLPYQLEFDADRILNTPYRVGTSDNDLNSIKNKGKFPGGVCFSHWFSDSDAWFVRTDVKEDGLIYMQRSKIRFGMDNEFDTENAKFKATERYAFAYADPRSIYGSQGS